MGAVYSEKVLDDFRKKGYVPFVCIVNWTPEGRAEARSIFFDMIKPKQKEGLEGVHAWGLIGRDMMIAIGWYNSPLMLQQWCTRFKAVPAITMDVCPAIDNFSLDTAFKELEARHPELRFRKLGARKRKSPKEGE